MSTTYLCYFEGGDADGRFERIELGCRHEEVVKRQFRCRRASRCTAVTDSGDSPRWLAGKGCVVVPGRHKAGLSCVLTMPGIMPDPDPFVCTISHSCLVCHLPYTDHLDTTAVVRPAGIRGAPRRGAAGTGRARRFDPVTERPAMGTGCPCFCTSGRFGREKGVLARSYTPDL